MRTDVTMLIKNLSERSLRPDGVTKSVEIVEPAEKPLDGNSTTTNQHFSPLLRQVSAQIRVQATTHKQSFAICDLIADCESLGCCSLGFPLAELKACDIIQINPADLICAERVSPNARANSPAISTQVKHAVQYLITSAIVYQTTALLLALAQ